MRPEIGGLRIVHAVFMQSIRELRRALLCVSHDGGREAWPWPDCNENGNYNDCVQSGSAVPVSDFIPSSVVQAGSCVTACIMCIAGANKDPSMQHTLLHACNQPYFQSLPSRNPKIATTFQ